MSLIQLVYASTASENLSANDLRGILQTAKTENKNKAITGFLCADKNHFLQCLEGDKSSVDELYKEIAKDPRHHDLKILCYEEIDSRSFPAWSMGGVLNIERHQDILKEFNNEGKFLPFILNGSDGLCLLKKFATFRDIAN